MTILLTPFISCTAKLPIYGFFTSVFFPEHSGLIMVGLYLLGFAVGVLVVLVSKNTAFKGEASIKRELGGKWAVGVVLGQCALAWGCAMITYGICILF